MSNKPIYTQYHYVYRITNLVTNKHYIGKRSSKLEPKLDLGVKYFSSSTDKEFIKDQKTNPENFRYEVIQEFKSAKEALEFEIKLHHKFDVAKNPNFYNMAKQTSTKFSCHMIGGNHQDGAKNSQYGTMWIHNPITLEKRKIKKDLPLPDGWAIGGVPPKQKKSKVKEPKPKVKKVKEPKVKLGLILAKQRFYQFIYSNSKSIRQFAKKLNISVVAITVLWKKYMSNYSDIFSQGQKSIDKQFCMENARFI